MLQKSDLLADFWARKMHSFYFWRFFDSIYLGTVFIFVDNIYFRDFLGKLLGDFSAWKIPNPQSYTVLIFIPRIVNLGIDEKQWSSS